MSGEGMSEGVAAGFLGDLGGCEGSADGALKDGFVKVMAVSFSCDAVGVDSRRGEDPLPGPVATGVLVFLGKCVGKGDVAGALGAISVVLFVYAFDMSGEFALEEFGQESDAVFSASAGSNDDLSSFEVDVLDS